MSKLINNCLLHTYLVKNMFELDIQKGEITSHFKHDFCLYVTLTYVIIFVKVPLKGRNWLTTLNIECTIVSLK